MKLSSHSISVKLDRIDKNIIRALQNNGRIQNNDLAREIGLSPSSCLRRVKLLEEAGVIQNYTAVIDPLKIGFQQRFGNQFSIDDLKQADIKLLETLNKLYIDALGGKSEDGDEKKEA